MGSPRVLGDLLWEDHGVLLGQLETICYSLRSCSKFIVGWEMINRNIRLNASVWMSSTWDVAYLKLSGLDVDEENIIPHIIQKIRSLTPTWDILSPKVMDHLG